MIKNCFWIGGTQYLTFFEIADSIFNEAKQVLEKLQPDEIYNGILIDAHCAFKEDDNTNAVMHSQVIKDKNYNSSVLQNQDELDTFKKDITNMINVLLLTLIKEEIPQAMDKIGIKDVTEDIAISFDTRHGVKAPGVERGNGTQCRIDFVNLDELLNLVTEYGVNI